MKTGRTKKTTIAITLLTVCMTFSFCKIDAEASAARTRARNNSVQTTVSDENIAPAIVRNTPAQADTVTETPAAFTYEENSLEAEILRVQNEYRMAAGLPAYAAAQGLDLAAKIRAEEMAATGFFSHTRPDGTFCFSASAEIYGENLYKGPQDAAYGAHIVEMLYCSPAHFVNMMDGSFETCGIGIAVAADGTVYCAIEYGY